MIERLERRGGGTRRKKEEAQEACMYQPGGICKCADVETDRQGLSNHIMRIQGHASLSIPATPLSYYMQVSIIAGQVYIPGSRFNVGDRASLPRYLRYVSAQMVHISDSDRSVT